MLSVGQGFTARPGGRVEANIAGAPRHGLLWDGHGSRPGGLQLSTPANHDVVGRSRLAIRSYTPDPVLVAVHVIAVGRVGPRVHGGPLAGMLRVPSLVQF